MHSINSVPIIDLTKSTTGCCALLDPSEWDEQMFVFDNKLFVKARTRSLFHLPLNMGSVMREAQAKITDAGAAEQAWLVLSYEASPWHADHYFAVSREVPGMQHERLSGTFLTKVFEGRYSEVPKWHAQLAAYAKSKGKEPLKTYFFYTVCPKCAKDYGKNYIVGFQQVQ